MNALHDAVYAEVLRQAGTEAIQAHITKAVENTVKRSIEDALRFGEVHQKIDAAVKRALDLGDSRLDIPSYSHLVLTAMKQQMSAVTNTIIEEHLTKQMADILGVGPRELKLSQIVEMMISHVKERTNDRYHDDVTVIVEDGYGTSSTIYLDEDGKKKAECAVRVSIFKNGTIYSLIIDGYDVTKSVRVGYFNDWQRALFVLYATGGKLIPDEDYTTTIYPD